MLEAVYCFTFQLSVFEGSCSSVQPGISGHCTLKTPRTNILICSLMDCQPQSSDKTVELGGRHYTEGNSAPEPVVDR